MRNDLAIAGRALFSGVALVLLQSCGGGGGSADPTGSGGVTMQVRWQSAPVAVASASADGSCLDVSPPFSPAGFGVTIPAAARTIRIAYVADDDTCCVAFAGADQEVVAKRRVVLSGLSSNGDLTVSAYATAFAPADGITTTCAADLTAARPCVEGFSPPVFSSAAVSVRPIPGTLVDAGDIAMFALPFVLVPADATLSPQPGETLSSRAVELTVADAVDDIASFSVEVGSGGATIGIEPVPRTGDQPCDDASSANPCSAGGALGVRGHHVVASAADLGPGPATLTIRATNDHGCSSVASFDFTFGVVPSPTTPTPTGSPSPTPTPTLTPTPSPTPTCIPDGDSCGGGDTNQPDCCEGFSCQLFASNDNEDTRCLTCLAEGAVCGGSDTILFPPCCTGLVCSPPSGPGAATCEIPAQIR